MATKAAVDDFLAQKNFAIAGMSRDTKKFGNNIFRTLKTKGYKLFPVHPEADSLENQKCYPSLKALPEKVDGLIVNVKPGQTEKLVEQAFESGINRIWIQQGSQSQKALEFCREKGMSVINNECIIMFTDGKKMPHNIHRWVWGVFGKLPK